jgi:hypothetical protein
MLKRLIQSNKKLIPKTYNFSNKNNPERFSYKDLPNSRGTLATQNDSPVERFQYNINFKEKIFENMTFEQLIIFMKQQIQKGEKDSFDTWYKCLQKFNEFLCDHQVSKSDIIEFISILDHIQPKVMERKTIPDDITRVNSRSAISQKHEEEYLRIRAPDDPFVKFTLFLKKHLGANLHKYLNTTPDKGEYRDGLPEGLEDLIGIYDVTFSNIEKKIIDDISNGRVLYSHSDCCEIIKSFSRNTQGTNMFYEILMRKISKHAKELSLLEILVLLNYLPHVLFNNEEMDIKVKEVIEKGRTADISAFYKTVLFSVTRDIDKVDDKFFMGLWQGVLRIKFLEIDTINAFLTSFEKRIVSESKEKAFFFEFLQILAYYVKIEENQHIARQIDFELIYKIIYEPFLVKNYENFSLTEITTVFWFLYHFKILDDEKVKYFEKKIRRCLLAYLNDPKGKIDTMGYETHKRYYDDYNIEPYDIEALKFFISTVKEYKGDLGGMVQKVLKSIELENTHPVSRKWFHF